MDLKILPFPRNILSLRHSLETDTVLGKGNLDFECYKFGKLLIS